MNVVFMGTPQEAIPALQTLIDFPDCSLRSIYSQPDRRTGRPKKLTPSPVKVHTLQAGIPLKTPEAIKNPEVLDELKRMAPDLIIVCAYGQILPQALLDIPSKGCFNLHFSFLPRWRGASPVQAAIRAGDRETGVTLQKVVLKLDAGPVIAVSRKERILATDTYLSLANRLSLLSAKLLKDALSDLFDQTHTIREQDETTATFCRTIKKEEGRAHWGCETAIELERKLRAFTTWPGLFTFDAEGGRLQITQLEIVAGASLPAGLVKPGFVVGTAEDAVRVLTLKPEGKKEMKAEEFLRGSPHLLGTHLGA